MSKSMIVSGSCSRTVNKVTTIYDKLSLKSLLCSSLIGVIGGVAAVHFWFYSYI